MARRVYILLLVLLAFTWNQNAAAETLDCQEKECTLLNQSLANHVKIHALGSGTTQVRIFCYTGQTKSWTRLFVNPRISIEGFEKQPVPDDLAIFYGQNASDVRNQSTAMSFLSLNAWLLLKEEHSFHPFNFSCIGLKSAKPYTINFTVRNPELWYIAYIIVGFVIFMCAPSWSRNVALHYTTGMTVGILASVLLIMFLLTRLMPQRLKTVSYVVMLVSSSASLFMYQLVKNYIQDICRDHWQIALGYVLVAGLSSLALVYRFGPVTDPRTLNIVCWALQGLGLALVYQGTQIPEASVALILLMILFYLCPKAAPLWLKTLRFRLFPPRHHFLTEEEYIIQGQLETKKALEELRRYCRSPDCNAWSVVSSLSSPSKFARFVDGESHISDEEMQEHEDFMSTPHSQPPDDSNNNASNNSNEPVDPHLTWRRGHGGLDLGSRGHQPTNREHRPGNTGYHPGNSYVDSSDTESEIEDTAYFSANRSGSSRSSVSASFNRSGNRYYRL